MYFLTGNQNKVVEMQKLIPDIKQYKLDLPEVQELDPKIIIQEKIDVAKQYVNKPFIIEDTCFFIKELGNFPGPLIKWMLQSMSLEKIYSLAPESDVTVQATIGYYDGSNTYFFEGKVEGTLVSPSGPPKFGWDPIFKPKGQDKTFQQMTVDEKNAVSHRYKAAKAFQTYLHQ